MADGRSNFTIAEIMMNRAIKNDDEEAREYKNVSLFIRGSEVVIKNRKTGKELVFDRKEMEGATEIFDFIQDAIPQWIGKRSVGRGRKKGVIIS